MHTCALTAMGQRVTVGERGCDSVCMVHTPIQSVLSLEGVENGGGRGEGGWQELESESGGSAACWGNQGGCAPSAKALSPPRVTNFFLFLKRRSKKKEKKKSGAPAHHLISPSIPPPIIKNSEFKIVIFYFLFWLLLFFLFIILSVVSFNSYTSTCVSLSLSQPDSAKKPSPPYSC